MLKERKVFSQNRSRSIFLIVIILSLSGFTHLWNTEGFPSIHPDEGTYIRRSLNVATGGSPQEEISKYDHPYFGQILLGSFLYVVNYPDLLNEPQNQDTIELLYFIPRLFMGILGIVDTFLIYLIASKRFSQRIGFVSSLLFAVMPLTWMTRRVYLDSLLLPFLLLSILLALYSINSKSETRNFLIWMSGIFLGIAIFTKIPVVTMIPLVIYIIFSKKKIKLTSLTYFLVPVFLISLLWPGYALITGNLNDFLDGVFFQLNREDKSVIKSFKDLLEIDPVLIVLGCVGLFYGLFRKDLLFVLWFLPFTLLLFFLNYSSWFHWILILPMFCISAGKLISDISFLIGKNFKHHKLISQNAIITEIIIFGFICTTMLITTDVTTPFFESTSFVLNYVSENKKISNTNMTIITGPSTSWIFKNTFHHDEILMNYRSGSYIHNKKIILVGDNQLREILSEEKENTLWQIKRLKEIYLKTVLINSFDDHNKVDQKKDIYPYTNFRFSSPSTPIEIRGN